MRLGTALLMLVLVLTPMTAAASPQIAMHVQAHAGKNYCDLAPATTPCDDFTVAAEVGVSYDVYLVAVQGPPVGISGATLTLRYTPGTGDGIDVFGWVPCADFEFPAAGWPADQTANTLSFTSGNCQDTDVGGEGTRAVLGALFVYAYDADYIGLTGPSPHYAPVIRDCDFNEYGASITSLAGFGNPGANPCEGVTDFFPGTCCLPGSCANLSGPECTWAGGEWMGFVPCEDCAVPTERTTWGRIKTRKGFEE